MYQPWGSHYMRPQLKKLFSRGEASFNDQNLCLQRDALFFQEIGFEFLLLTEQHAHVVRWKEVKV